MAYTPNPESSYFTGPPSSAALSIPNGVSAMAGAPQGGFNPTNDEYWKRRSMTSERERFMSEVYKSDPRTTAASAMLSHQLFGQEHQQRQDFMRKIGGPGNFNELVGWSLNHPMISSMTGGSIHSLATGALGAASGGMTYGGRGVYGDNMVALQGARALLKQVNSQFYSSSGAANLSATQGLSRDQIGGVLMTAGAQGAFAGLPIGEITRKAGGIGGYAPDMGSLTKITDFTKTAAKFLGGLIDVFGNGSVGQLLGKAKDITGLDLSRIENANAINTRLQSLRNSAHANGMDTASVYALAQAGTASGRAMGLHESTAGALSHQATLGALNDIQSRKLIGGSLYLASKTPGEFQQERMAEMTEMTFNDPVGQLRMNAELMFENGYVKDPEKRKQLRDRLAAAKPGEEFKLANDIRSETDVHPSDMMMRFGGPGGVAKALSAEGMRRAISGGEQQLYTRQEAIMDMRFGSQPDLLKRLKTESMADLAEKNSPALNQAIKEMQNDSQLASYRSTKDREIDARRLMLSSGGNISTADRGAALQGGMVQGLLERLSGNDPASTYQMVSAFAGNSILGSKAGRAFTLDADALEKMGPVQAAQYMENLQKEVRDQTGAGKEKGNALLNRLGVTHNGPVKNIDQIISNLRNPSVMGDINKDYVTYVSPEGTHQLMPKATHDFMKDNNVQVAQMLGAAKLLGAGKGGSKESGSAQLFLKMSEAFAKDGTAAEKAAQLTQFNKEITKEGVLKQFTPEQLKQLAGGAHGGLGKNIANALEFHKGQYQKILNEKGDTTTEGKDAAEKLKLMETQLEALRKEGVYTDGDLGITNLTGTLIMKSMQGNEIGTATFEDAKMKGKAAK